MKSIRRGFTLIELLVVISIVALLSTLAVVSLSSARRKSNNAKKLADVNAIYKAIELYYNETGYYPNTSGGLDDYSGRLYLGRPDYNVLSRDNGFSNTPSGTVYMGFIPPPPASGSYGYHAYTDGNGQKRWNLRYGLQIDSYPNHHFAGPNGMDSSDHGGDLTKH